eukprot:TRINITY_DN1574_c0_g1_i1.p1 TRINITY_DN1574_c0_g1~~TRINITY_DN1574_c0_g1_i1.p1  ORF type:complete len:849 (-),score=314.10 TRINITY_DN1574_c0_g1_i1:124-2670(-)
MNLIRHSTCLSICRTSVLHLRASSLLAGVSIRRLSRASLRGFQLFQRNSDDKPPFGWENFPDFGRSKKSGPAAGSGNQQQQKQQQQPPSEHQSQQQQPSEPAPDKHQQHQQQQQQPHDTHQQQQQQHEASSTSSAAGSRSSQQTTDGDGGASRGDDSGNRTDSLWPVVAAVVVGGGLLLLSGLDSAPASDLLWPQLIDLLSRHQVVRIDLAEAEDGQSVRRASVVLSDGTRHTMALGSLDAFDRRLQQAMRELRLSPEQQPAVVFEHESGVWRAVRELLPTLLMIGVGVAVIRTMSQQASGSRSIFSVGRSTAKQFNKQTVQTTFKDVAGLPEAKQEIHEFVDFLRSPAKYKALGARIPRGALLVGPPGTGKTLLAKAAAGEASVPFFYTSGSDFIEMFVGVGPSRVRDLFQTARAAAPCIVFIDEIDAIGRARGRGGYGGGNDERENTLNQILVEMDGFSAATGIVVLAGTNRPDILDRALVRPGRFDRQIAIDKPDLKSREEIFGVHLKALLLEPMTAQRAPAPAEAADCKGTLDAAAASEPAAAAAAAAEAAAGPTVPPSPELIAAFAGRLARLTPGFSGADIANACNEAALHAARTDAAAVTVQHFEAALDRVIGGLQKRSRVLTAEEKRVVAYHEAGHAVAGWFLEHCDPVLKVNIIPRTSGTLGYAQYLPQDLYLRTRDQLSDMMCAALAGRVAEHLVFGEISTGAQDDLQRVANIAYAQVGVYGMSEVVGPMSFPSEQHTLRRFSDDTAQEMDEEVRGVVEASYARTMQLLTEKRPLLVQVAELLLEKESLTADDLRRLLGVRTWQNSNPPYSDDVYTESPNPVDAPADLRGLSELPPALA